MSITIASPVRECAVPVWWCGYAPFGPAADDGEVDLLGARGAERGGSRLGDLELGHARPAGGERGPHRRVACVRRGLEQAQLPGRLDHAHRPDDDGRVDEARARDRVLQQQQVVGAHLRIDAGAADAVRADVRERAAQRVAGPGVVAPRDQLELGRLARRLLGVQARHQHALGRPRHEQHAGALVVERGEAEQVAEVVGRRERDEVEPGSVHPPAQRLDPRGAGARVDHVRPRGRHGEARLYRASAMLAAPRAGPARRRGRDERSER